MMHLAGSKNTSLSRSLMAGFASGIVAAILNAAYNYFFRKATGFTGAGLIDPLVIFVSFPILFILTGFIFYEMIEYINRGPLLFTIIFALLILVAIILGLNQFEKGMEGLYLGILIITGILICFLLPFLATHPRIFMDQEELNESAEL
jgi:hypothetical protein